MKKINCIIVEDEYPAVEILKEYLSKINNWNILAVFDNGIDAISYLSKNKVDVIFLDIQLPELNGIDFIKTIENPPLIIITSAYNEHAVEAFELVVYDYLLKPYSFNRFLKSVTRVSNYFESDSSKQNKVNEEYIIVRENRKNIKILVNDIIYVESQKEYVKIVCQNKEVITKMAMAKIEKLLVDYQFIRVHRSFLVSINKVTSFTKSQIIIDDQKIPIGRLYQRGVVKLFS